MDYYKKKKIEKKSKTCEAQKKRPDIRLRKKEFFKYFANQTDTFARCFEFHDYWVAKLYSLWNRTENFRISARQAIKWK